MDLLNRILVATMALGLAACAVVALLVVVDVASPTWAPGGWLRDGLEGLSGQPGAEQTRWIVVTATLLALGLIVAVLEARPLWSRTQYVQLDTDGTSFKLAPRTIERIVEHEGTMIRGVSKVRPSFKQNGNDLQIHCQALVQPSTDIARAGSELRERVRSAVENMTGMHVSDVDLTVGVTKQKARVV